MKFKFFQEELITTEKNYVVKNAGSYAVLDKYFEFSEAYEVLATITENEDKTIIVSLTTTLVDRKTTHDLFNYRFGILDTLKKMLVSIRLDNNTSVLLNRIEVLDEWVEIRYNLKTKYRKQAGIDNELNLADRIIGNEENLNNFIQQSGWFPLLSFPLLPKNKDEYPIHEKECLHRFLGEFNLNTKKKLFLKNVNDNFSLIATRAIDNEIFNKKPFTKWLKDRTDIYDLKVDLELENEEHYRYDDNNILKAAEQFISVGVMGCYSNTVARTLIEKKKE